MISNGDGASDHDGGVDEDEDAGELDSRPQPARRPAAVRQALEVFIDPWSFAVMQEAFFGVRRFDELQRNLGISRGILAKRLRHLVGHGIFERTRYQRRPDRYEYRLTEPARELYPVVVALHSWGERWTDTSGSPQLTLIHRVCGKTTVPQFACKSMRAAGPRRGHRLRAERVDALKQQLAGLRCQ